MGLFLFCYNSELVKLSQFTHHAPEEQRCCNTVRKHNRTRGINTLTFVPRALLSFNCWTAVSALFYYQLIRANKAHCTECISCLIYFFLVQKYSTDIQWILSGNNLILHALHAIGIPGPSVGPTGGVLVPVRLATVGATEASQMAYGWVISIPLEMCCLGLNVSYSFNLTTRLIGLHFWILALHLKKKKGTWHCTEGLSFHTVSQ